MGHPAQDPDRRRRTECGSRVGQPDHRAVRQGVCRLVRGDRPSERGVDRQPGSPGDSRHRHADETAAAAAKAKLDVPADRVLIVVFGGSLGARTINNAVVDALGRLRDRADLAIRHIIGHRDFADRVLEGSELHLESGELEYTPIEYEDDMATVFAAADLVICRSGATSGAELAVTGTPSVLIPLPGAPGDHQTANAQALERAGGAELIPTRCSTDRSLSPPSSACSPIPNGFAR